jgi:hypothetical protein
VMKLIFTINITVYLILTVITVTVWADQNPQDCVGHYGNFDVRAGDLVTLQLPVNIYGVGKIVCDNNGKPQVSYVASKTFRSPGRGYGTDTTQSGPFNSVNLLNNLSNPSGSSCVGKFCLCAKFDMGDKQYVVIGNLSGDRIVYMSLEDLTGFKSVDAKKIPFYDIWATSPDDNRIKNVQESKDSSCFNSGSHEAGGFQEIAS